MFGYSNVVPNNIDVVSRRKSWFFAFHFITSRALTLLTNSAWVQIFNATIMRAEGTTNSATPSLNVNHDWNQMSRAKSRSQTVI